MKKLYEITVSFCVEAEDQTKAWSEANRLTEELQATLHFRSGDEKDMEFFYIDEPQEVIL